MDGRQKHYTMTTQQPDNFFRKKLGDYGKPAPHVAWDRIEASLAKTSAKTFAWWKVAASFTLLAVVGFTIWVNFRTTDVPMASQKAKKTSPTPETSQASGEAFGEEPEQPQTKAATDQPLHAAKSHVKAASKKSKIKKQPVPLLTPEPVFAFEETHQSEITPPAVVENENVQPPVTTIKKSSPIKFTITAEETDKYLDKTALAEATSKEQKSSTFKKLLKKANDLKSNQDPFGDLREKKNEILALNFKNDKRGQNK
jgi:hypothetical protein